MIKLTNLSRRCNEIANVSPQTSGRPRKVWTIDLGYASDTSYTDKVTEKRQQHAKMYKLHTEEGYDVIMLPVVLSAGTLLRILEQTTTKCTSPVLEEVSVQQAPPS